MKRNTVNFGPNKEEIFAEIRSLFDSYLRAGVSRESAFIGLILEYNSESLVARALLGPQSEAVLQAVQ